MALKRKPPAGNIRRVAPIGENLRYAITSKANETVQCESFQERKVTLLFDRDSTVQEYRSQPEQFAWTSSQGRPHTGTFSLSTVEMSPFFAVPRKLTFSTLTLKTRTFSTLALRISTFL